MEAIEIQPFIETQVDCGAALEPGNRRPAIPPGRH